MQTDNVLCIGIDRLQCAVYASCVTIGSCSSACIAVALQIGDIIDAMEGLRTRLNSARTRGAVLDDKSLNEVVKKIESKQPKLCAPSHHLNGAATVQTAVLGTRSSAHTCLCIILGNVVANRLIALILALRI